MLSDIRNTPISELEKSAPISDPTSGYTDIGSRAPISEFGKNPDDSELLVSVDVARARYCSDYPLLLFNLRSDVMVGDQWFEWKHQSFFGNDLFGIVTVEEF